MELRKEILKSLWKKIRRKSGTNSITRANWIELNCVLIGSSVCEFKGNSYSSIIAYTTPCSSCFIVFTVQFMWCLSADPSSCLFSFIILLFEQNEKSLTKSTSSQNTPDRPFLRISIIPHWGCHPRTQNTIAHIPTHPNPFPSAYLHYIRRVGAVVICIVRVVLLLYLDKPQLECHLVTAKGVVHIKPPEQLQTCQVRGREMQIDYDDDDDGLALAFAYLSTPGDASP